VGALCQAAKIAESIADLRTDSRGEIKQPRQPIWLSALAGCSFFGPLHAQLHFGISPSAFVAGPVPLRLSVDMPSSVGSVCIGQDLLFFLRFSHAARGNGSARSQSPVHRGRLAAEMSNPTRVVLFEFIQNCTNRLGCLGF
jgi:hypothetical protein